MRIVSVTLVVALGLLAAPPAIAAGNCAPGSYAIMDNLGKTYCEPVGAKPAAAIRTMEGGCPAGSRPWKDFSGNSVCRSAESLSGIGKPSGIQGWPTPGPTRAPGPPGFSSGVE